AFGWILDHSYLGAIPRRSGMGGIRLRTGNIQVGDEGILGHLFAEPRFATWAIGDIHVESKYILPNARRDEFEASVPYAYLQDEFIIFLKRISQTVRDRSLMRNRIRKARAMLALADQWLDQARDQHLPPMVQERVRALVQERIDEAQQQLDKIAGDSPDAAQLRQHIGTTLGRRTKLLKDEESMRGRRSAKDKVIDVALSVILEHSRTPAAGLVMSKRVLSAFEFS